MFALENFATNVGIVEDLAEIARDLSVGLALLAIAWVLRDPVVAVALSGTRRPQEIEENVRALEVVLSPQTLERIDRCLGHAAGQTDTLPIPDWA